MAEPPIPPNWKPKHAWAEIDRTGPPKRPAGKRVTDFHEIYSLYDEATVREQARRCIQCPVPSCVTGCPLSNRIPEWIALAAEGELRPVRAERIRRHAEHQHARVLQPFFDLRRDAVA